MRLPMRRSQGKPRVNSVRMKKMVMAHRVRARLTAMGIRNSHSICTVEYNDSGVYSVSLTISVSRRCAFVVVYTY
jgi:Fe2+ transport system protein FeoA